MARGFSGGDQCNSKSGIKICWSWRVSQFLETVIVYGIRGHLGTENVGKSHVYNGEHYNEGSLYVECYGHEGHFLTETVLQGKGDVDNIMVNVTMKVTCIFSAMVT